MKNFSLTILAAASLTAFSANADLTGRSLNCTVDSAEDGSTRVVYQFLKGPQGNDLALFTQLDLATTPQAFPYTLVNGTLTIELNNDPAIYDISKPSAISRSYKSCVFPGVPDGDSQAVCSITLESCVLN